MSTAPATYIPARRFMGRSRLHAKTSYLRLQFGSWVQIVELRDRTALVAPFNNTVGDVVHPQFSHLFTVKLTDLQES